MQYRDNIWKLRMICDYENNKTTVRKFNSENMPLCRILKHFEQLAKFVVIVV